MWLSKGVFQQIWEHMEAMLIKGIGPNTVIVYNQGVEYWVDCAPSTPPEKYILYMWQIQGIALGILVGVLWDPREIPFIYFHTLY